MKLWQHLARHSAQQPAQQRAMGVDDYLLLLNQAVTGFGLVGGVQQTMNGSPVEEIESSFVGYVQAAYRSNGVVFACMLARLLVFSAIRFRYQRLEDEGSAGLFGHSDLRILEEPWLGGTTQDLLIRMLQDADLAGNAYITRIGDELVRLRPDWVSIILEPREAQGPLQRGVVGFRRAGYMYREGGTGDPVFFLPEQVAHFAPIPDPLASYRGMSWLTPVLQEIQGDQQMTRHKQRFFENAATPNLAVSLKETVTADQFREFMDMMESSHRGVDNAYKTLYLGGGADVRVIGADFEQMNFTAVQGRGETRIAAASGVPPVIVGLSEGLQSATYSNYSQARRRFADGTMHPLWQNAAGSLAPIVPRRPGARLWYSARGVPFLREDSRDQAEIQGREAATIATLVKEGFTPESAVAAVVQEDWTLLEHTGLRSVQLHPEELVETNDSGNSDSG